MKNNLKQKIFLFSLFGILFGFVQPIYAETDICSLQVVECEHELSIEQKIRNAARIAGVSEETAVRIAKCESTLNPLAKNKHSSATGLYQFTTGTWKWIGAEDAGLDRTNPDHSIAMFMKWYKKYPTWWQCQ